jgi:transposase-like protein
MTNLNSPIFQDEAKAIEHMEASRWPDGANCPHCGSFNVTKMGGLTQAGMFLCNDCRDKFTVRTGTVFERSHIPLHKWILGMHLMAASKKGVSAHQLHRMLGITYKSAWFMSHRIREAMAPAEGSQGPLGGEGKTVEADEVHLGRSPKTRRQHNQPKKTQRRVLSLIERGGEVRSIEAHLGPENWMQIKAKVNEHVHPASRLVTDQAQHYKFADVAKHESVNHSAGEYVRGDVHTNTLEGYFSLFKRGLVGTYQHMSEQHLGRYLAEFDFRMNNRAKLGVTDTERAARILKGAEGKRLTYNQAN